MTALALVLCGFLIGGVIAFAQQRKWVSMGVLAVLAASAGVAALVSAMRA